MHYCNTEILRRTALSETEITITGSTVEQDIHVQCWLTAACCLKSQRIMDLLPLDDELYTGCDSRGHETVITELQNLILVGAVVTSAGLSL